VAGIPVALNWSVLAIFALLASLLATDILPSSARGRSTAVYWAVAIAVALLFFVTLFAHEIAHALVARHYGVKVTSITLWMLGGVTALEGEPETPRQHLAVAVVGPVVSLVTGALCEGLAYGLHVWDVSPLIVAGVIWLGGTNLLLGVFNLLPAAPLDGGRVLQSLVWMRVHNRAQASLVASRTGRMLGQVLIAFGLLIAFMTTSILSGLWLAIIGWFVYSVATVEQQATTRKQLLGGVTVADVMSHDLPMLPAYQDVESVVERVLDEPHEYYPVVEFDGTPVGVVSVDALVRVPETERSRHPVREVTVPIARLTVARPEQPITDLLAQGAARQLIVVVDAGRLVGLITPRDFTWALRRANLGKPRIPVAR
jgi:Zn-dependent protease/predicted transcriptional regulator